MDQEKVKALQQILSQRQLDILSTLLVNEADADIPDGEPPSYLGEVNDLADLFVAAYETNV